MADSAFDVDGVARLTITFTVTDTPTDPSSVTLTVGQPDGTKQTISGGSLTHDGPGAYHYDLPLTMAGQWKYRWVGTGAAAGVKQGSLMVRTKVPV